VKERLNAITSDIIAAALAVHEALGPGMLEAAYEACLAFELLERGLSIERQKSLPLTYRGHTFDRGYRLDLLVEESVVVEVKAIEKLHRVHRAQMLSYLRMTGCRVGLVVNFNVRWLVRDGVRRVVNDFPD
jgi:GxxExxY protein